MGRTFASLKNYQIDGNKEMMAIGIMNMAGSCASCYVTTGIYLNYICFNKYIYIDPYSPIGSRHISIISSKLQRFQTTVPC